MSQYGSDSDRPRGRRHRPGSDWSGHDAPSQSEREFPDLQPIRPRDARARDSRMPDGFGGGGEVPGGFGGSAPGGRHAPAPGGQPPWGAQQAPQGFQSQYGQYGQPEAPSQPLPPEYGAPGYGGPEYGAPEYGATRPAGRHSAPQPTVSQQPVSQQPVPQSSGRRRRGSGWDEPDSDDPMAAFSARWHRRGQESLEGQRKRLYLAGGGVVAVAIAVLVYFLTGGGGGPANTGLKDLVTTFLPGELQQVPNACTSVSSSTLSQALSGPLKQAAPPLNTGAQSQCTWTLDNPPTYRVLEVNLNAYAPSSLASGDGSATFAAIDAFGQAQNNKQKPKAGSGQPTGTVTTIPNLGSSAFSAMQQFRENGATMDMATVEVRYHNVIIQVVLNGIDHSDTGKQYGPVSQSTLLSQAQSIAQQVTSKVSR